MTESERIDLCLNIVDDLLGSMQNLDVVLQNHNVDTANDSLMTFVLEFIDSEIFECSSCGWWHEICEESEENNGDRICLECAEID